jgi:hypothetical protein
MDRNVFWKSTTEYHMYGISLQKKKAIQPPLWGTQWTAKTPKEKTA